MPSKSYLHRRQLQEEAERKEKEEFASLTLAGKEKKLAELQNQITIAKSARRARNDKKKRRAFFISAAIICGFTILGLIITLA